MKRCSTLWLKAIFTALTAAGLTMLGLNFWQHHVLVKKDVVAPSALETTSQNFLDINDNLSDKGWLQASGKNGARLSYTVFWGKAMPKVSDEEWKRISKQLLPNDTLRPKRNCVVAVRAEKDRNLVTQHFTFNFCRFVENIMRNPNNENDTILKQLLFSYSQHQPLVINYDNLMEDVCDSQGDRGKLDNLYLSFKDDEDGGYHIDSVRTYSTASPKDEALQDTYPPIAFINASKMGLNKNNTVTDDKDVP